MRPKDLVMKSLTLNVIFLLSLAGLAFLSACAGSSTTKPAITAPVATAQNTAKPAETLTIETSIGKVMVLDFPLSDLTDLPNPP